MVIIYNNKFNASGLNEKPFKKGEEGKAFCRLVECSFGPIIVVSKEGSVLFANQPAIRLFGNESGVREGTTFKFPLIAGERMELFVQGPELKSKKLEMHVMEAPWKGRQAYIASFCSTQEQNPLVTVSKQEEIEFKKIFNSNPYSIIIHNTDGRIIEINDTICKRLGYTYNELINLGIKDIFGSSYVDLIFDKTIKFNEYDSFNLKTELLKKDGNKIHSEVFTRIIKYKGRVSILCTVRDIAKRIETETELALLEAAIKQAAESVHVTDAEGVIVFINPAFESITGYSRDQALGVKAIRLLMEQDTPREHYHAMWKTLLKGHVWTGGLRGRTRDGSIFEVEASISPVRDSKGEIVNYVAVMRDVSQEIALERQLRQAQKMEAIGTLAGGIAHDFNNILSAIIGYTELGMQNLPKEGKGRKNLKKVLQAGERARDLVKQILTFSRQSEEEYQLVDFHLIIKEGFKLLRSSLPSSIKMHQNLIKTGNVMGDPTQLHQVVMNLCTNASQAMSETGGTLTLSLDEHEITSGDLKRDENLVPGKYARLTVSDTGHGIDPGIMDRIFEPYFTTKEKGKGTGLGLSVVHGIVQRLSGKITVSSRPGKGSTFKVYIPLAEKEVEDVYDTDGSVSLGFERVLVVDDEKVLAEMTQQMLESHGYWVESYTDSRKALDQFKADPYRYDIVLTDMTMPDMSGDQLAKEMLKIRPEIPIVLCTGFSEKISEEEASAIGVRAFALKPLVSKELVRILRGALNKTEDKKEKNIFT
jgi:PAS domain S-box-containing protein